MIGNEEVQKIIRRVDSSIRLGRLIRVGMLAGLVYSVAIARQGSISKIGRAHV